jgi:restriction system protein
MPIPQYKEFFKPLLEILADEKVHTSKDLNKKVADKFNLSQEDRKELLPSGSQSIVNNRVGWARTYLKKANLIENEKRGHFKITQTGLELLKKEDNITIDILEQYPSFNEFKYGNNDNKDIIKNTNLFPKEQIEILSPKEQIENSYSQLRNELMSDILEEIKKQTPEFFENLVIDLLLKMGYGGSRKSAGKAVGKSGDEGIDGIINEDRLGLDKIYIQAKRYSNNSVGRPEIQKFVGALSGKGATKGIFITTSYFTNESEKYVTKQSMASIILINGKKLSELLIDFNVGVSTKWKYEIKQLDLDYFESQ